VAGEPAQPVSGADGTRVPLLRANFRPEGLYTVSFVYLHDSQPLAKSGDAQMALATVDLPVGLLEWELFLPEQYSARPIAGNVIPASLAGVIGAGRVQFPGTASVPTLSSTNEAGRGEIVGRVVDEVGSVIPGATITLTTSSGRRTVVSDQDGSYRLTAIPVGPITVTSALAGFNTGEQSFVYDGAPKRLDFRMGVAGLAETVQVVATTPGADARRTDPRLDEIQQAPSQNVVNMQRKVAGVLPVRIDVPRAGTIYRFVRPLVLDDQTTVSFRYKRR